MAEYIATETDLDATETDLDETETDLDETDLDYLDYLYWINPID